MAIFDRISYVLIGLVFGAVLGLAGWWLYGQAHSLHYRGWNLDPVLRHWVTYLGGAFAVLGFLFKERVGDLVGDVVNTIFQLESDSRSGAVFGGWIGLVLLAITIAAVWFTVPA